jgi:hypothetical protein
MFIPGDYSYFFDKFLLNKILISYIIQDFTKSVKAFKGPGKFQNTFHHGAQRTQPKVANSR